MGLYASPRVTLRFVGEKAPETSRGSVRMLQTIHLEISYTSMPPHQLMQTVRSERHSLAATLAARVLANAGTDAKYTKREAKKECDDVPSGHPSRHRRHECQQAHQKRQDEVPEAVHFALPSLPAHGRAFKMRLDGDEAVVSRHADWRSWWLRNLQVLATSQTNSTLNNTNTGTRKPTHLVVPPRFRSGHTTRVRMMTELKRAKKGRFLTTVVRVLRVLRVCVCVCVCVRVCVREACECGGTAMHRHTAFSLCRSVSTTSSMGPWSWSAPKTLSDLSLPSSIIYWRGGEWRSS